VSCSSTAADGPGELLHNYSIPTQADFLFAYSTIPGIFQNKRPILFDWSTTANLAPFFFDRLPIVP
jgi:hypothetical protein